ncbi:MAG: Nif3-like dinuclear metal center hexameric protein, partial [Frankiaceae bacterium]|nr:Nif3-like dinuclear metal center hexameric protein [Frankiaceae bacterium]
MIRLSDALEAMDGWFPPGAAQPWDAVGLVCGDPREPVERILLAVDPVPAVVEQAERLDAQLIITHHPLLLSPVHGVSATTAKGALIHRLIRGGRALHVAHTNAD